MQQVAYPVRFTVDYPDRPLNRLTTGFRILVAIPILIVLGTVSGGGSWESSYDNTRTTTVAAGGLLFFGPLLLILFRQKYPRWWFDWNLELQRFGNRVGAYLALLDDRYPATDQHQSVDLDYPYPDAQRDLNRWLPLVKWLLAIPHYLVLLFLDVAALVVVVVAWFAIVFTGRYPRGHVRLRGGRHPLEQPGDRLCVGPGHRPLPTVPSGPVMRDACPRPVPITESLLDHLGLLGSGYLGVPA